MPTSLPTDPALTKAVDTFGNGTYDGLLDEELHGEDDESREPSGSSLPSEPSEGFDMEFFLSYPQETALGPKHASLDWFVASLSKSMVPGDADVPPLSPRPADNTLDGLAGPPSDVRTSDSELPDDHDNPSARSDYYDRMTTGSRTARLLTRSDLESGISEADAVADLLRGMKEADRIFSVDEGRYWPSEDSGSYVTQEQKQVSPDLWESDQDGVPYEDADGHYVDQDGAIESFPEPEFNDNSMSNGLDALGNAWSGYVVEDLSNPRGFPNTDFVEEADFLDENPIMPEVWHLQPFGYASVTGRISMSQRTAATADEVRDLTKGFLKEHGKKNIVRRSVTAFLQERGLPQYLASEILRCMRHEHKIVVADVLDTFPLAEDAPDDVRRLASVHSRLVELEMSCARAAVPYLRRSAASLARSIAALERARRRPGNI